MERLLTPRDIAQRYGVTQATGRNYIRRIAGHMENPLRVAESLFRAWEAGRAVWGQEPEKKSRESAKKKRGRPAKHEVWIPGVSKIPMRE